MTPSQTSEPKSKLALKAAKRAHHKAISLDESEPSEALPPMQDHLYSARRRPSEARPSAFASLLVDGAVQSNDGSVSPSVRERSDRQQRRHRMKALLPAHLQSPSSVASKFSFNEPSPDDLVLNARRGTALGKQDSPRRQPSLGTRSQISASSTR